MNKRQARDLAGLLHIAAQKGYTRNWILAVYLERHGEWPPYEDVQPWPEPAEPTKALIEHIRKKTRDWHKKREKRERRKEIKRGSPPRGSPFGQMYAHMRSIVREGT